MSLLTRTLIPTALCAALAVNISTATRASVEINWEALDTLRNDKTKPNTPLILHNPAAGRHPEKLTLTPPRPAVPRVTLIRSTPPLPLSAPSTPVDISTIAAPTQLEATRKPRTSSAPIASIEPVLTIKPDANASPPDTTSIAAAVPGGDNIAPTDHIQLASLKTHNEPNDTRPLTKRGVLTTPALAQILFDGQGAALHTIAKKHLSALAGELSQQSDRIELQAFGGAAGDRSTPARRLSLKRALAVRAYLIALGVGSNRIDIHALGGVRDGGPANRVDVVMSDY